jgi:hypothetical protein
MSSQEWQVVYRVIQRVARGMPRPKRRLCYSDGLIAALFFWAVAHDRPMCWACQRENVGGYFRPRRLPSVSQFCRRVAGLRFGLLLERIYAQLAQSDSTRLCFLDGRPLPVGACSKDAEAKAGRVYGGFARGYRLHACVSRTGQVLAWRLTGLNGAEARVAHDLIAQVRPRGLVLADGNYDSAALYEHVSQHHGQLVVQARRNAGRGHIRQSPARLRGLAIWHEKPEAVRRLRAMVDRYFGQQSSFGGGLAPLPAWVRTPPRVRRWVAAKLTIYHVRLRLRKRAG